MIAASRSASSMAAQVGAAGVPGGERQRGHLFARGVGQLGSSVAGDHVPESGKPVEILPAARVRQQRAFACDPHVRGVTRGAIVLRMNQVRAVARQQVVQRQRTFARRITGSHLPRISRATSNGSPSENRGRNSSTESGPS